MKLRQHVKMSLGHSGNQWCTGQQMKGTEEGSIQVQYERAQYNESNKKCYLGAYQDKSTR